jgi:hypothetical protein
MRKYGNIRWNNTHWGLMKVECGKRKKNQEK